MFIWQFLKNLFLQEHLWLLQPQFCSIKRGRTLNEQQVNAIIHLVSSSVPSLAKSDVTVVDQYSGLLSNPNDDPASALSDAQLEHRLKLRLFIVAE